MGLISNPTRLILVATIFFLVSSISGQDSVVENNERQESEGSGKELGRRGMVILNLDLLFCLFRI